MDTSAVVNLNKEEHLMLNFIAELRKYECLWVIECPKDSRLGPIISAYEKFRNFCELDRNYYDDLWKTDRPPYKNISVHAARENLRKFCEQSDMPATIEFVKNTITRLIQDFAREIMKESDSLECGKELYKSKLYYYEAIFFIVVHNAPQGFKWRCEEDNITEELDLFEEEAEDQVIDDNDFANDSSEYIPDVVSPTPENDQIVNTKTSSRLSTDTQRKCNKVDQNKRNGDHCCEDIEIDEHLCRDKNAFQIICHDDSMDSSSVQDNSAPPTCVPPISEQLPDIATPNSLSSNTLKRKNIASEQVPNVETTCHISPNAQKHPNIDFEEGNTNDLIKVACNKLIQEMDEFDGIGNNVAAKLRAVEAPQRIIAEKLISNVLFHAQMNSLTPKTLLCQTAAPLAPQLFQSAVLQ